MRMHRFTQTMASLFAGMLLTFPAVAQDANSTRVAPVIPSRVLSRVDESRLVRLGGNTHPMAKAEFDKGAVSAQFPMERITLLLKRSAAQEAALNKFMEEQTDPKSANFHHWLTPEEFGAKYGPSDYDVQAVTNWLQNHGFRIDQVTKGRTFIEFSGTAAQVQTAFHTEIHHFVVNGEAHVANTTDPQIPEALSPVVSGIVSLHNFFAKPQHHFLGDFTRTKGSPSWTSLNPELASRPEYLVPGTNPKFELVTPLDFAAIYNLTPLWNAGITGAGQTIAIAGRSDVSLSDVQTFRSSFGLPVNNPVFIVNGADPGVPSAGDKVENTLDVEWSGAVAKNATIKFVTTKSTTTSDGASASAIYIINNNVAKVMSFSYGNCELAYGTAGNAANNSLWQQAAAQGITAFVASGDQGSAACDGGGTAPYGAGKGLAVSGASTTPYNVAVGGTDFNWGNLSKTYWKTGAANTTTALGYIPEVPWNGTCASTSVDQLYGFTAAGYDTEQACQYMLNNNFDTGFLTVAGGTGGVSKCTTPSGTTPQTCAGGYAKPSWQVGTGVPADGKRDVPDVSLFAASGALNDAYAICDSASVPCNYTNTNDALSQAVGGTSVASPAMAGIMALVNQKMGSAQGNANVAFYKLAAKDNRGTCNAVSVAAGNACNFYDITTDNNAVPCVPGTLNCVVKHSGDTVGILSGYASTAGYDLATGLGSVNAANLVNNWASVVTTTAPAVTLTPTSLTFASTNLGVTTAAQVVTVKNTGTAALSLTSISLTGTNASSFLISAKTCGTAAMAVGASCTVSVEFKPAAAGALTASLAIADNASGSPQLVKLSGTGVSSSAPTLTLTPTSIAFPGTVVGATSDAQIVTVKNTGTVAVTISSIVLGGTNATSFQEFGTCGTSLAAGASCSLYVGFKPTAAAALTGTISITDNATGSPQKVTLTGTGTAAPTLKLSTTAIAFPTTAHGTTSAAVAVTLTNGGTATMTLNSITLTGTNPTDFQALDTCGATLAPAANCVVYVAFKPAAAAAYSAKLTIADNGAGSPQAVTLTGTGK